MSIESLWTAYQAAVIGWQANQTRATGERMANAFEVWAAAFLGDHELAKQQADGMRSELARSVAWAKSA